jgi:glutamate/tyrosine decarboxylase-like PLP-dependent enzyme
MSDNLFILLATAPPAPPTSPHTPPAMGDQAAAILQQAAERLHDNSPTSTLSAPARCSSHPIARAAYALAVSVSPDNHALDGGPAGSAMEVEAVAALADMFGLPQHLGHLSSGGTFANLEAFG